MRFSDHHVSDATLIACAMIVGLTILGFMAGCSFVQDLAHRVDYPIAKCEKLETADEQRECLDLITDSMLQVIGIVEDARAMAKDRETDRETEDKK